VGVRRDTPWSTCWIFGCSCTCIRPRITRLLTVPLIRGGRSETSSEPLKVKLPCHRSPPQLDRTGSSFSLDVSRAVSVLSASSPSSLRAIFTARQCPIVSSTRKLLHHSFIHSFSQSLLYWQQTVTTHRKVQSLSHNTHIPLFVPQPLRTFCARQSVSSTPSFDFKQHPSPSRKAECCLSERERATACNVAFHPQKERAFMS
jgi:hypothetical protein